MIQNKRDRIDEEKEKLLSDRADQLEKIGFILEVKENSITYVKGQSRMIPTIMMCASTKHWNDFISKHSQPNNNE